MLKYFALLAVQLTLFTLIAQPQDSGDIPFEMVKNTIVLKHLNFISARMNQLPFQIDYKVLG